MVGVLAPFLLHGICRHESIPARSTIDYLLTSICCVLCCAVLQMPRSWRSTHRGIQLQQHCLLMQPRPLHQVHLVHWTPDPSSCTPSWHACHRRRIKLAQLQPLGHCNNKSTVDVCVVQQALHAWGSVKASSVLSQGRVGGLQLLRLRFMM
jgi:hypothetical protein